MAYIPFEEVKARFNIEQVADLLGLIMKRIGEQLRGPCPACGSGGDRALVITPSKSAYFCWAEKKGGDLLGLAAHIRKTDAKGAAAWLVRDSDTVKSPDKGTVPRTDSERGFTPLDYLEPGHEAVAAIGFTKEIADKIGLGYAPRGILKGTVAVPIRDEEGVLLGYLGITEAVLPKTFTENKVVPLKRA